MRIRISFPEDRDFAGRLEVIGADGGVVLGPFPAAGRAHDQLAVQHGNPLRDPLLPYGDTPLGTYAVRGVIESGAHGVVHLESVSGQAALADAQGRFRFFIQAGGSNAALYATAGSIRLLDRDQQPLIEWVRGFTGRLTCEIVCTSERGQKIASAPSPLEIDPPPLPEPREIAVSARFLAHAIRPPRPATRFYVAVERSGGGTGYGESGGGDPGTSDPGGSSGGQSAGSTGDGGVSGGGDATGVSATPDQPIVTDASPVTGVPLAPQDSPVTDSTTGASQLLSSAPQTGLNSLSNQNGWINEPEVGSYVNGVLYAGSITAYVGDPPPPDPSAQANAGDANNYTGTPPMEPYSGATNGSYSPDASLPYTYGPIERDTGVHNASQVEIDAMVQRLAQYDAQLAAQQNQLTDPSTGAFGGLLANQTLNTSAPTQGAPPPSPYTGPPPSQPSSNRPLPQAGLVGTIGGYRYIPGPTIDPFNLPAVELPSLDVAVRASGYPLPSTGSPVATHVQVNPDAMTQGFNASNPASTATPAEHALGNLGVEVTEVYEGVTYRYLVTQNSPYVAMSGNVEQAAFGDYGFQGQKYLINLEALGPGNSVIRNNDVINSVQEYAAANPAEAGRVQTYINNQPVEQEMFARSNVPPEAITPLNDARTNLQAWTESPPTVMGALPQAMGRGAGLGAGVSTVFQLGQMAWSDQHYSASDYLTVGGRTALAGGTSGAVGSAIQTSIAQSLGTSAESSLASRASAGAFGGGAAGGPAAAIFQLGSMALSDQQYSTEDYVAKGTRAGVEGALSGALSAGVVGAIWGSEVPILGNAVGFVVGFVGYLSLDYFFGDEIEGEVRSLFDSDRPVGDFPLNDIPTGPPDSDPGGFLTPTGEGFG